MKKKDKYLIIVIMMALALLLLLLCLYGSVCPCIDEGEIDELGVSCNYCWDVNYNENIVTISPNYNRSIDGMDICYTQGCKNKFCSSNNETCSYEFGDCETREVNFWIRSYYDGKIKTVKGGSFNIKASGGCSCTHGLQCRSGKCYSGMCVNW